MGELIEVNIEIENEVLVVTSLQVSNSFEKQHGHVLRDIDNLKKDVSNFGEMFFETILYDSYGREQRAYSMNRDGFSLLAMGFTGKNALEWKVKYIAAFNAMEKAWNTPEQIMARALKVADTRMKALQMQLSEAKPKIEFFDAVASSKTAMPMDQVAKVLDMGIGRNKLFETLREKRILDRNNVPYQEYVDRGYFRVIEQKYVKPNGDTVVTTKTLVYQRGLEYIRRLVA